MFFASASTEFDMRFRHVLGDVEAIIKPIQNDSFTSDSACICLVATFVLKRELSQHKKRKRTHVTVNQSRIDMPGNDWLYLKKKISQDHFFFVTIPLLCDVWPTVFVFY
jgi:hypothetical protein